MKKKVIFTIVVMILLSCAKLFAQTTVQPKIMVIPYTKEGEDIRTILEADNNKRIVLTKIKEAFDAKGISTIDFSAKLKTIETANTFDMDNKTDIKSQIIEMSGADIYVEAEIICNQQGASNSSIESNVKIILTAYDASTGASLANKVSESGNFYTTDIARLGMRAISQCSDEFLKVMQMKFSDIAENGRSLMLFIGFDEGSIYTMESEVGNHGLLLQDEIELWISEHAYNGNYHIQGISPVKMIFDDIKLPLVDEATGRNYNINRFSIELLKFFRSLNLNISRSSKGNILYITVK